MLNITLKKFMCQECKNTLHKNLHYLTKFVIIGTYE